MAPREREGARPSAAAGTRVPSTRTSARAVYAYAGSHKQHCSTWCVCVRVLARVCAVVLVRVYVGLAHAPL